jgi:hypothetical protein
VDSLKAFDPKRPIREADIADLAHETLGVYLRASEVKTMADRVANHYSENLQLADVISQSLRSAGKDLEKLTTVDLATVDEFHIRGRKATLDVTASVGRHGSMKPGGRRAGEVERHNTGFTTPTYARGRRSLGRQTPRTRGGLDLFDTHTQLAQ